MISIRKSLVAYSAAIIVLAPLFVFMMQEKLIFYPEKLDDDYEFSFAAEFRERYFNCPSGNLIHGLFFPSRESTKLILYFHGNAGSLQSWGNIAGDFLPHGYNVLIVDYPGYGKSRGTLSEKNLFDDAQWVYGQMSKEFSPSSTVIYGRSIGCAIAARLAYGQTARMLVMESPFYSLVDLVKKIFPFLPTALLRYPFRTDLILNGVKCPVYVLHGNADEVVYFGSSLKLQKLFKPGDRLFPIEGGHHNDLNTFKDYHKAIESIL